MRRGLIVFCTLLSFAFLFTISLSAQDLRVNVMPDGIHNPAMQEYGSYAWPNHELEIWGNVIGGTPPYTYVWDFGDGSPVDSGDVTNPRNIAMTHQYTTLGPKFATLIVTDAMGVADTDVVQIDVTPEEKWYQSVNLAIQKGLKWLYLNDYNDATLNWQGWNPGGKLRVGAYGMELLAFQNQRHFSTNDPDEDIYAEHVQKGLDILFSYMHTQSGIGRYFNDGSQLYETGIALMALVATGTPDRELIVGTDTITYYEIAQDVVSYLAWAQNDSGPGRGGWRYGPNYYNGSDNSVTQWPAIGLEAAETEWGMVIPASVKSELLLWISYSQHSSGGFGYNSPYNGRDVGLTGAGLCELAFCDVPNSDTRIQKALNWLNSNWHESASTRSGNFENFYAMYAVAKGCRIAVDTLGNTQQIEYIGGHDWQIEYDSFLVNTQYADGHWNGTNYGCDVLDTDFGILILTQAIICNPVAVIDAPNSYPANKPFEMDGSASHHAGACPPNVANIEWLWDFDASDGVDWDNPDAIGQTVINPGYVLPSPILVDTFTITLRVKDNQNPPKYDVTTHTIIIDTTNNFPIADCGGPYAGRIGEEICFNGSGSFDPDSGDYIASYSWDLDGDGVFGDCFDSICCTTFYDIGSWYIGLIVTDSYGAGSIADTCFTTIWTSQIDVAIDTTDISFSPSAHDSVTLSAAVHCYTLVDTTVSTVRVRFYDGNPDISALQIGTDQFLLNMDSGDVQVASVTWLPPDTSAHDIYVVVDPDGELEEYNENNNVAYKIYQPSGLSPTNEWINVYCGEPIFNGTPLSPGDIIKAYDPDGVLCGIDTVRDDGSFGFMPIYADEPYNSGDQGAEPGDTITFMINDTAVFSDPVVIWTANGDRFAVCDFFTCEECHLEPGWNLISWNRNYSADIEDFMALLGDDTACVEVILGFDRGALTYDPDLAEYSTLHNVDYHFGYWLKVNCPIDVAICAGKVPHTEDIPIYSGWNLVGYWPDETLPVETALSSIMNSIMVVMGFDNGGLTFVPGDTAHNTLTEMQPCFGYWIKSTADALLVYPGWNGQPTARVAPPMASVTGIPPSRTWVSLYGSGITLDDNPLNGQAVIEVYTSDGVLCGRGQYTNGILQFTPVYGYDASSQLSASYPKPGDEVTVYVNGTETNTKVVWTERGDRIRIERLYSGTSDGMRPAQFVLNQNTPNPFNPTTEIRFELPKATHVRLEIYNIVGQLVNVLLDDDMQAGAHEVQWHGVDRSGQSVASGLYFYRIKAGDFIDTKKMILLK